MANESSPEHKERAASESDQTELPPGATNARRFAPAAKPIECDIDN